jgi:hypothetical protein
MSWRIMLMHTRRNTLLKRAFEAAFPGRVVSFHVPALGTDWYMDDVPQDDVLNYFRRNVYDPGLWDGQLLTVYGDGNFHHYTYALTRLAAEQRSLEGPEQDWTYFHFDQHRDDWGERKPDGTTPDMNCGNFVDSICHDHGAIPFMVGPDAYPFKDSKGYRMNGTEIPIYSNYFTKVMQESRDWKGIRSLRRHFTGVELPSTADLRATPSPAYLSFDLDLLAQSEIVTNYDQNPEASTRRICQILDKIRPHKRVFSADILGLPDDTHHPLSVLTMIIVARKIMGMGTKNLLAYQGWLKQKQAALITNGYIYLDDRERESPIEEGELLEVLRSD